MIRSQGGLLTIHTSSRTAPKLQAELTWPFPTFRLHPGSVSAVLKLSEERVTDCSDVAKGVDCDINNSTYVAESF